MGKKYGSLTAVNYLMLRERAIYRLALGGLLTSKIQS